MFFFLIERKPFQEHVLLFRRAQRGATTVHKFGTSLGTPSKYHYSIKVSLQGQHVWSKILTSSSADVEPSAKHKGEFC
jgi:hypothetical protein